MRVQSTTLSVLAGLTALPSLTLASGTLGFALGMVKTDNSCKSQSDYEADFDAISSNSAAKIVRIYSSSQCESAANILPAAKSKGFQVVLGVWPDGSQDADKAAVQAGVKDYADQVYAVTVGSEVLYRGDYDANWLLEQINDVKSVLPDGIKIGTADSWNKFQDGTADPIIKGGVNILLANAFAYWQDQNINNASATYFDDLQQAMGHIQETAGSVDSIEIWNGETGWPTDGGTNYGSSIAGTDNAKTFWQEGVCGFLAWGGNLFYFEAFDEPSKGTSTGQDGTVANEQHWGAMNSDRSTKFSLSC